jgi:hypothetical protein
MSIRTKAAFQQSGAALVVLLALLLLVSAAILLEHLNDEASASTVSDPKSLAALADAKAALIAWAATHPPSAARESTAGTLPYPDRNGDGNYDGMADCDVLGVNDLVLVGRLPSSGEDTASCGVTNPLYIDVRDGAGEPLWYAVSRNLLAGPGVAGGPINPDMGGPGRMAYPWIKLKDSNGNDINDPRTNAPLAVAAVIFAPGPTVGTQDRDRTSGPPAPANYLDRVTIGATTYDNADVDGCPDNTTAPCAGSEEEQFVVYPNPPSSEAFNDQVTYITVDELMRAVEKRVLGEVAVELRDYGATHGAYPWLAAFRNPRALASGSVDGGSSIHLDHAAADFLADGVVAGDIVFNISDGSSGPITAVTAIRIDVEALQGGAENDFDAGENYEVRPSFKSTLARRGHIPVHLPNEVFKTGFTADWDLDDIDDYYESGDSALWADDFEFENNTFTFLESEGTCMWTHKDRVDCYGIKVMGAHTTPTGYPVTSRTVEVQFSFEATDDGTPDVAVISPPTVGAPRTRSVTIRTTCSKPLPWINCQNDVPSTANGPPIPDPSRFGAVTPPELDAAPFLPQDRDSTPGDNETWIVRITDVDGGNTGVRAIVIDHDVRGHITLSGIRYDLGVAYDDVDDGRDEIPEWFVENNWHHFIFAAFSQDVVAGGNIDLDGNCTTPTNTCLSINADGLPARSNDVPALLISSGVEWTNQNRAIGDCDGIPGIDPNNDSFLCAYFDSNDTTSYVVSAEILRHGANTANITTELYARDDFGDDFNDQVRIIECPYAPGFSPGMSCP